MIAPDVPIDPDEALSMLRGICDESHPDLIVGHSMGGFWAQKLRGYRKILINPDFHISRLMRALRGEVKYLSARVDGEVSFTITDSLCDRYLEIEKTQFEGLDSGEILLTQAMFAEQDELVDCSAEFELHYPGRGIKYPGTHIPTHPELKKYLLPLLLSDVESDS